MPTLTAELRASDSHFLRGFGEYCAEHALPDSEVHDGLLKAAAALPEVGEELRKSANLGVFVRGLTGAAKAAVPAAKAAAPLADDALRAATPAVKAAVPAAAKTVAPAATKALQGGGAGSSKLNIPTPSTAPAARPGLPLQGKAATPAVATPGSTLDPVSAKHWMPNAGINPKVVSGAPLPSTAPAGPVVPSSYSPPKPPGTTASGVSSTSTLGIPASPPPSPVPGQIVTGKGMPATMGGGVIPGGGAPPVSPPGGMGGAVPPVSAPAAGPGGWGQVAQNAKNIGINTAIGAGTGLAASGGDPRAAVFGGLMGGMGGGRATAGQAAMTGSTTGLLMSAGPNSATATPETPTLPGGMQSPGIPASPGRPAVPPDTAVPWTNSASVTEMAKGRPEVQQQLQTQIDQMEQQFQSTYKPGDQLTPEHHQQLQKIAAGRAGLEAAKQKVTPQELGAGAEQLYHKLTADGVMSQEDLGQFLQSDASKAALKDFAAQQTGPVNPTTGQPEANWTLDPQTLLTNFTEMMGKNPWQAAALVLGIPLALHGAYSAMTGGGIGGLLSMVVGGGLAAFGGGAFNVNGLGGKNLFAPGAQAPAAGAASAATAPAIAGSIAQPMTNLEFAGNNLPEAYRRAVNDPTNGPNVKALAPTPEKFQEAVTAAQNGQLTQWVAANRPQGWVATNAMIVKSLTEIMNQPSGEVRS